MKDAFDSLDENNNDINQSINKSIISCGFTFFSITMFLSRSLTKTERIVIENYPKEWRIHYDENNYHDYDPILAYAKTSSTPIHWYKLLKDAHPDGKAVLKNALRFGIGPGFSIPFRGKSSTLGIVSINAVDENPSHDDYARCIKEILAITPISMKKWCSPSSNKPSS